jgi:transcriptional regulator with XRE-family HTH domain
MDEATLQTMLGAAIRERRTGLGLSQEAFADLITMHRAYYSKVERGEKNLTLQTIWRVTQGLGVKPSQLLKDAGL